MIRSLRLFSGVFLAIAAFAAAPIPGPDSGSVVGRAAAAGNNTQSGLPPSLQQRRRTAREAIIQKTETHCRAVSRELAALADRPCAAGDRLDARSNVCYPRRNVWMPYVRWDPAAGRCKPRDTFDGAACVGTRQRYDPGKRHAQTLARSAGMYGHATAQVEAKLENCQQTATGMKHRSSTERNRNARQCRQAQKLGRTDLVQFYCQ